jgi:ubiquinone/menaquinone biosynthesis C-methylase UbiE
MRLAVAPEKLRGVYARLARRYDLQHGLLTFANDARGRRMVVKKTVFICLLANPAKGAMTKER